MISVEEQSEKFAIEIRVITAKQIFEELETLELADSNDKRVTFRRKDIRTLETKFLQEKT